MPTLTIFGKTVRKLRLDKGMRLLDMAERLGHTSSYCSAIETGRKPIPDGYVRRVIQALALDSRQSRELNSAVDKTRTEVRVQNLSEDQRELLAAFARRIDELPDDMITNLRKAVLKSIAGDTPFYRSRKGILVPPQSAARLREFADKVRSAFVEADMIAFPIIEVLEFKLGTLIDDFCFDVRDEDEMAGDEGRVVAGSNSLILRLDVYTAACNGAGRARFTACHELGHFLMHRHITMSRAREDSDKIYCDAEWQADVFAGTLLMSPRHLSHFSGPSEAADLCGISQAAATYMWGKYYGEAQAAKRPPTPTMNFGGPR